MATIIKPNNTMEEELEGILDSNNNNHFTSDEPQDKHAILYILAFLAMVFILVCAGYGVYKFFSNDYERGFDEGFKTATCKIIKLNKEKTQALTVGNCEHLELVLNTNDKEN